MNLKNLHNLDNPYHACNAKGDYSIVRDGRVLVPLAIPSFRKGYDAMFNDSYAFEEVAPHLVRNMKAPLIVQATDGSIEPFASTGDKLLVETESEVMDGDLLAYCVNGYYSARQLVVNGERIFLRHVNEKSIEHSLEESEDINIIGIIRYNLTKREPIKRMIRE